MFKPVAFKKFVAQKGSLSLEFFAPAPQNRHFNDMKKMLIIQTFKYFLTTYYVPDTQRNNIAIVTSATKENYHESLNPKEGSS